MKKERVFWGLFFIVGAAAMVVSRLGFLGDIGLWTIFFTVFLAAALVKSVMYRSASGILFSIAFLCILYDKQLGITALTPWTVLGAALLGSIGCSILFDPWKKKHWHEHYEFGKADMETVAGESIHLSTSFGEGIKYIDSDDFKRANIQCSFGELKVYFDNALIQDGQAVIAFDVSFGGVELFLPKEWTVDNQVNATFGEVEEKNRNDSNGSPVLRLVGKCSFAGISIIYV